MPLRNQQISRHPSNVETRGFLGLNRRWIPRPASWAGPSNKIVIGVNADLSCVSSIYMVCRFICKVCVIQECDNVSNYKLKTPIEIVVSAIEK